MLSKDDGGIRVTGAEVARYRSIYSLGEGVNAEHVIQHEGLERRLTARLIASSPDTRWAVFEEAYSTLYRELPWLNAKEDEQSLTARVKSWGFLVRPGTRVYEVGSGKAHLLRFLASIGCDCVATEITRERGQSHYHSGDSVTWRNCDGVNLSRFEGAEQYNFVVSTQVLEHLHPDDVPIHLREVRSLLKSNGQYIFDTPHASAGPHDLSKVFNLPAANYMHLQEYTWIELTELLKKAGYSRIQAVFALPRLCGKGFIWRSSLYWRYMLFWDWLEHFFGLRPAARRRLRRVLRLLFVPTNIWVAAFK